MHTAARLSYQFLASCRVHGARAHGRGRVRTLAPPAIGTFSSGFPVLMSYPIKNKSHHLSICGKFSASSVWSMDGRTKHPAAALPDRDGSPEGCWKYPSSCPRPAFVHGDADDNQQAKQCSYEGRSKNSQKKSSLNKNTQRLCQ